MLDIQDPTEARKVIRENKYTEQTAGSANKYVQGNLCILPSKYAMDFASFCQKNPKPCPLIGFGTKGDPSFCLLYTSPSPRDRQKSRMPSSA